MSNEDISLYVGAPASCIVNFDSNIIKIVALHLRYGKSDSENLEFTTSGMSLLGMAYDDTTYTFEVTLSDGFVIDTITVSDPDNEMAGKLVSVSDTSFDILAGSGGISQTITVTSKAASSSTDETWVLKSSGMTAPDNAIDTAINFKNAAGDAFTRINIYAEGKGLHISYYNGTEETFACSGGDGVTGSNATITFLTSPTGDLLEWLQANGTKQQETLTPVLSAGTYKWADILGNMPASTDFFDIKINFTSNNNNYSALGVYSEGIKLPVVKLRYVASDDSTTAYNEGDWVVDSYQTLIIVEDQQVSQAFYNWAITGGNLVKQTTSSAPKLMSFGGKYFKTSSGKYLAPPQN